jgi:hypothetical protein
MCPPDRVNARDPAASQNFSCETGIASIAELDEVPRRTVSEVASKELSHNLLFCEL